ncbi:MAG: DeoR/GlpR transcriptional regulator [Hyphomicrobiales bacterium]|nr:DeoR/GlpR transcriptional regulator [Hyphomicrobiales bacterium]
MTPTKRQASILEATRRRGMVRISDLAEDMSVSLETIRRDIRPLVEGGELIKMHGAVRLSSAATEAPFERRMREHAEEKRLIADHVAAHIEDGDSIMLDTGTTTSILARELLAKRGLTIVTNSSDIARTLATVNGNKVYMAGGELHGDNGAAFGRSAIDFIAAFNVRYAIISIAAIDAGLGLMDYHLAEAEFARTVLGCGERRLVITDHTKFNRTALVRVAGFEDIDRLVTDRPPPPEIAERLESAGTVVDVAERQSIRAAI